MPNTNRGYASVGIVIEIGYGAMSIGGIYGAAGTDEERFKVCCTAALTCYDAHYTVESNRSLTEYSNLVAPTGTLPPPVSRRLHPSSTLSTMV